MQFARESLFDVIGQVEPLLERHYEELCLNREAVRLKPRWDVYAALERQGNFLVYTGRVEGELKAYSAFFFDWHLHYAALKLAANDVLWIEPEYRLGMTPARFIRFCENSLKNMGAHKIVYHAKHTNNLAPLLGRLKYGNEEAMCGKLLIGD